jgi:hypothetical protein
MVIHVKEKTDKCNHVQQLKHENKVLRNTMAIKILISLATRKIEAYKERLHKV